MCAYVYALTVSTFAYMSEYIFKLMLICENECK